ncbi:hypothetical protein NJH77_15810 [Serratia fonticola]|uniref:hypothetical protein n=1 Tax=Serratia fonticola TaxID=47917 RepID=UPI002096E539|nr:hypothetical protein [Serratia fonticola]MCO7510711.1 hypothetical protein [Serratia fonticola]
MSINIQLIGNENNSVLWEFEGKEIRIDFEDFGHAIYSRFYELVVVMFNKKGDFSLNMKAYSLDGIVKSIIYPSETEDITYNYISTNDKVKSNIVVIGSYNESVGYFYDWQFEVDLEQFKITNRIAPSY